MRVEDVASSIATATMNAADSMQPVASARGKLVEWYRALPPETRAAFQVNDEGLGITLDELLGEIDSELEVVS